MLEEAKIYLRNFAQKHNIIFKEQGEVGFGRPCVGLLSDGKYIDYNPFNSATFDPIEELENDDLYPPDGVSNAYHKHNCLAVLAQGTEQEDYDAAILELYAWIKHIESLGEVKIVTYDTGATGMQAAFTGKTSKAITVDISKSNGQRKITILND